MLQAYQNIASEKIDEQFELWLKIIYISVVSFIYFYSECGVKTYWTRKAKSNRKKKISEKRKFALRAVQLVDAPFSKWYFEENLNYK